jgi:hypothetical protein
MWQSSSGKTFLIILGRSDTHVHEQAMAHLIGPLDTGVHGQNCSMIIVRHQQIYSIPPLMN